MSSDAVPGGWSRRGLTPWLLVTPMVVGLLGFAIYPLIYLLFLSASKSLLGQTFQEWVGFDNFRKAWNDSIFTDSLVRSLIFALPVALIELVAGVAIALLIQRSLRRRQFVLTLILLPMMTPPIMVATAWKLIFNPTGGLLNGILLDLGLIDAPISYLGQSPYAFMAVGVADAWQWTPFIVLLTFAALQSLPEEVEQAALVDGASGWRAFWSITFPMILPGLTAVFLLRSITAFKLFDLVFAITFGGPGFDTNVGTFHIFRTAFRQFDVGYGAAQTIIFGLMVGLVTLPIVLLRDWSLRRFT
jgi:multiple sugar transport system permease protein